MVRRAVAADAAVKNNQPVDAFTADLLKHVSAKSAKVDMSIGMNANEAKSFSIIKALRAWGRPYVIAANRRNGNQPGFEVTVRCVIQEMLSDAAR